ncbi:MAG: UTP--glucose-1-phosphate uridylyltransferase [Desulfotalea sp.]
MLIRKDVEPIIRRRMKRRGLQESDIDFFLKAWRSMDKPEKKLDWQALRAVKKDNVFQLPVPNSEEENRLHELGISHMHECAIVKLNGGRSTTMGGQVPKCMVTAKDGKSFLDITMGQIIAANDRFGIEMPLVLMNSFFTDHVTEKIIGKTPLIIMNFIQNDYPRIQKNNMLPLDTGTDMDWCPAGHGDFFASIEGSGLLDDLLNFGIRYVFISNIDNLSAEISPVILGKMLEEKNDFLMEVTRKTERDVKGGSPVYYNDKLSLLEIAQVPESHLDNFQNINEFRYFNTNNLWVDLAAVKEKRNNNELNLPIILNNKHIAGTDVIQIETAMGAGIQSFNSPGLIDVPRNRFAPVKKLSDLFLLQSDIYIMNNEFQLSVNPERPAHLTILPEVQFHHGFPEGNELEKSFVDPTSVSMLEAEAFIVDRNVFFEEGLQIKGEVVVSNTTQDILIISDGTIANYQQ